MATILIIEDETILLEETLEWLRFEGHEAIGAADGKTGVTYAKFYLPDLILCDISMPGLDGYEVLLAVQGQLDTVGIPFIFLTARTSRDEIRRGMELGADDYITKPFTRLELLKAIETRLARREQKEQEHQHEVQLLQKALVDMHDRRLLQGKLLKMLSHDFNGPLTSILLTSTMLCSRIDRFDKEAQLQHLERINAAARLLQQMLEDVVLVNQLEQNSLTLQPKPVIPSEFLQRLIQVFRALYSENCDIVLPPHADEPIVVDDRLLRQVAMNLVTNALKFSLDHNRVEIELYRDGEQAVLRVRDNGIGIPEADQATIFEAFNRGSNVSAVAGSGLGLAIVKQAVDLHGGTIALESKINGGTTFTVKFPLLSLDSDG